MSMEEQEQINRIVSDQLGVPREAELIPPAEQPQETETEKAQTDVSPNTEDDKTDEDPMAFIEIQMGGDLRKLTDKQIASTYDRYSKLNHRHAEMSPVIKVIDQLVAQSGATPGQAAQYMVDLLSQAGKKNVTMGGDGNPSPRPGQDTPPASMNAQQGDPFANWESENDVALPPGYREQAQQFSSMNTELGQIKQMLMGVLNSARGTTEQAMQQQSNAAAMREEAIKNNIRVNIDNAANRHGLAETDSEDFMVYMAERGFTLEDFIDPELADKVTKDFSMNRNGPELEQLRKIHERRIAFKGTMPGTPAADAGPAPQEGDPIMSGMINTALNKRQGMG